MSNKTWDEVHNELMKDPDVAQEYAIVRDRIDRVMKYTAAREAKGNISQSAVARGAGVKFPTVQALENDNVDISSLDPLQVELINNFLGITN